MAVALQRRQVFGRQQHVRAGRDCDGVFSVVRDTYKGGASGLLPRAQHMHYHVGRPQRVLKRVGISIVTECQQHVGAGTAGTRAGHGLIRALASGVGLEGVAQHCFTRPGDVRRTHNKVKIGRAGNENHG